MRAHVISGGKVTNTIEVDSLSFLPNLLDASLGGKIGDLWNGSVFTTPQPEVVKVSTVTMRQARTALLNAGLLNTVNSAIAAMTGAAGDKARIEWEFSSDVIRTQSLVISMGAVLGMNSSQLDDLFTAAAAL